MNKNLLFFVLLFSFNMFGYEIYLEHDQNTLAQYLNPKQFRIKFEGKENFLDFTKTQSKINDKNLLAIFSNLTLFKLPESTQENYYFFKTSGTMQRSSVHKLEKVTYVYILSGTANFFINGHKAPLKKGFYTLNAHDHFSFQNAAPASELQMILVTKN